MSEPIEVVIVGRDDTGDAFQSATGGLAAIANTAMGMMASQIFTKLADGVVSFTGSIISEAREASLVQAGLNQTLETMGGVSGMTAEAVNKLSDSVSQNSKYTDEQVTQAQGLMLTFDKIGKETFPRATQMAADMSSKFKMDLNQATTGLSKALNGTKGSLGALAKQGITFTDDQKKVIESLFEAGKATEAQGLIMDAIGPQVDGFAATQVTAWEKVQKKLDNVKEDMGAKLLPIIDKVGNMVGAFLDRPETMAAIDRLIGGIGRIVDMLDGFAVGLTDDNFNIDIVTALSNAFYRLGDVSPIFIQIGDGIVNMSNYLDGLWIRFSEGQGNMAPIHQLFVALGQWFDKNAPLIQESGTKLFAGLQTALGGIGEKMGPLVNDLMAKFGVWFTENGPALGKFVDEAVKFGTNVVASFVDALPYIVSFSDVAIAGLELVVDQILDLSEIVIKVFSGDFKGAMKSVEKFTKDFSDNNMKVLKKFGDWIASFFGMNLDGVKKQWDTFFTGVVTASSQWWTNLSNSWTSGWNNLIISVSTSAANLTTSITTALTTLRTNIMTAVTSVGTGLSTIFTNVKASISTALTNIWTGANTAFTNVKNSITTAVTDWVSSVTAKASEFLSAGQKIIDNVREGVVNTVSGVYQKIVDAVSNWLSVIGGNVTQWWNAGVTMLTNVGNGISSAATDIYNNLVGIAGTWIGVIGDNANKFYNVGKEMLTQIQNGINSQVSNFTGFVHDVIIDAINAMLASIGLPPIGGDSMQFSANISRPFTAPVQSASYGGGGGGQMSSSQSNSYNQPFYNFGTINNGNKPNRSSIDRFRR